METNKPHTRIFVSQTIKVLFFVFALIIAFLFALNGRYMVVDEGYILDKWKKEVIDMYEYIK